MLELNIEAVVLIKDRPSEKLRGGGGQAKYMFMATKKIILMQGKIGIRKMLTKNIYAGRNTPTPAITFLMFQVTPSQNEILKNNGLLMSLDPGKGCH